MKGIQHLFVTAMVFIAMLFGTTNANVYVFGLVVDTADNPIADALIIISTMGGPGGGEVLDTLSSGADGKFAKDIVYNEDLERVRYAASKEGYTAANGMGDVVQDTADLDTITLRPGGTPVNIYVFGMVVDTSDNPIADVQIILSTQGTGGIQVLDTLSSGNDGNFAENVEVSEYVFRINYEASKDGYLTAEGNGNVMQDTCDLDTITLIPGPTPIINNVVQVTIGTKPNKIKLFNLKGQMLYYGSELDLKKALQGKIARSQMLTVHYMLDNTVLYREKIIFSQ